MDFFAHQEKARRNTSLLVIYFALAVVAIIGAVYLAVVGVLFYGQNKLGASASTLWYPDVLAAVSLGSAALISGGSLYKFAELAGGGETVARSLGGRRVNPNTTDLGERVLLNVVEEMAIASGTPVPPVYVLDHEPAINAFAAGTTPQNAVISVTRGTIDTLKRDELQGVVAHEFSHILNSDMRLNLRLIGLLNGILLIAIIGEVLLRSTSSSSSSSDSDGKKGGNPLPLLGLCLYAIGYIGVFFGHLIKSAVSRQREFLADASAVQFTRYPDGIEGALKKIGGLSEGSRLKTAGAEEASHMFFGNGLRQPLFELMATHPPLVERIRRIDPRFDGKFPRVEPIEYSTEDVIDPQTLSMHRAAAHAAEGTIPAAPPDAAQGFAFAPAAAVAQVGAPREKHLDYAAAVIESLPGDLAQDVRDPLGAVAVIYGLLLADDNPEVLQRQLDYLAREADPPAREETLRLAPWVSQVQTDGRLPLVSMTLPALKGLSPRQLTAFHADVTALIEADQKVTLFEYAIQRLVLKRLLPRLELRQPVGIKFSRLSDLVPACSNLLSTLACYGTRSDSEAASAFQHGAAQLASSGARIELQPRSASGLRSADAALDQLAAASPAIKKQVLSACAACIGADGRVTVEEAELLRVISDALGCPMPPLLDSSGA